MACLIEVWPTERQLEEERKKPLAEVGRFVLEICFGAEKILAIVFLKMWYLKNWIYTVIYTCNFWRIGRGLDWWLRTLKSRKSH